MSRTRRRTSSRTRAFTLVEILTTLILLTAFALVASKVFRLIVVTLENAPAAQDRTAALDQVVGALRQDVWSSRHWTLPGDRKSIVLQTRDSEIRWAFDADGIRRVETSPVESSRGWPLANAISIPEMSGTSITLEIGRDRITLPSQILIANGTEAPR